MEILLLLLGCAVFAFIMSYGDDPLHHPDSYMGRKLAREAERSKAKRRSGNSGTGRGLRGIHPSF